jgi:hypothetical protein
LQYCIYGSTYGRLPIALSRRERAMGSRSLHYQQRKERKKMSEDTCKKCGVEMWREGRIDDDIKLCHPCYLSTYERGNKVNA